MPTATDLVTDLPADFEVFGQAVATSMADLLGGSSGYILSKASATDMDFTWIPNDQGDITGVTAGNGITVTDPTGPVPTVAIDTAVTVDKTTAQTLSNKTLTTPIISSISNTGTLTLPTSTDTLVGRATTDTLTNKTLTSPALTTPTISTATTNGDLLYGTGSGALQRLGIGSSAQVLTVASGIPSWATPAASGFIGAFALAGAIQSIPSATDTALLLPNENFDTSGFHSTTVNTPRMTIPSGKAGYYAVNVGVATEHLTAGNLYLKVRKNGSTTLFTSLQGFTGANGGGNPNAVVSLAVADYIEIVVYQSSGSSVDTSFDVNANFEWFSITYLGA